MSTSSLFDSSYYLRNNPDVAQAGVDPLQHYLTYGWHEGRDPNLFIDTSYYLETNPDVAAAGVEPLQHYLTYGWHEGRDPYSTFDTSYYLQANPDVAAAGINPLAHFSEFGFDEARPSITDTEAELAFAQPPGIIRGQVSLDDEFDDFFFIAPHDGFMVAELVNLTADADLYLYDDGDFINAIASSENPGTDAEFLEGQILSGNPYILSVELSPLEEEEANYDLGFATDFQLEFLFS